MFNDPKFIEEFIEITRPYKTALEVGSVGELKDAIRCKIIPFDDLAKHTKTYNLVFSSGVLQHVEEPLKMIKQMKKLGTHVLNFVPNASCEPYMRVKNSTHEAWAKEKAYTEKELAKLYKKAGLTDVETGYAGYDWCKNRFGGEGHYLVWALGK